MVVDTEWFKRMLKARGMSQRDIAGIDQARFCRLINGKVAPSAAEVVTIARALCTTTEEVLRCFGFLKAPADHLPVLNPAVPMLVVDVDRGRER